MRLTTSGVGNERKNEQQGACHSQSSYSIRGSCARVGRNELIQQTRRAPYSGSWFQGFRYQFEKTSTRPVGRCPTAVYVDYRSIAVDGRGICSAAPSGQAQCRMAARRRRGLRVVVVNSLQLQHDCAFRDSWSGHTSFAGILGDPLPCCPTALVGTSLVLVDRNREPSASGAHERIAHETLYPPDETFHFSFVLLQEVEKRLRAFAGIASNDSIHDTPPPADVLHVNAPGT